MKTKKVPVPLGNGILVVREDPKAISKGGIVIPTTSQQKTHRGTVIARSPTVKTVAVGEEVIFQSYGFTKLELDGVEILVMDANDVLVAFRDEKPLPVILKYIPPTAPK